MPRKTKESKQSELFEMEQPLIEEEKPKPKKRINKKKIKEIKQELNPQADEKQIELEIEEKIEENKELEAEPVAPAKPPRKKREMSEETRQRLKDNLARGRKTALENRKRKKRLKEIAKKDKIIEEDKIIEMDLKKRNRTDEIASENDRLRLEIEELKKAKANKIVNSSESKPKPTKPKQVESIAQGYTSPPPKPYQPPKPQIRSMLPGGLVLNL